MGNFQNPPTYANPILVEKDPATGENKATFNPAWLDWFIRLTANLSTPASGTSGGGLAQFANTIGPNPPGFVFDNIVVFDNSVPLSPFTYIKDSGVSLGDVHVLYADDEGLTGTIDGLNTIFTSVHDPSPVASMIVYHNGPPLLFSQDFTVSGGNVITFNIAPIIGDYLLAFYRYLP